MVCSFWQSGKCENDHCTLRHMELKVIICSWSSYHIHSIISCVHFNSPILLTETLISNLLIIFNLKLFILNREPD